MGGFFRLLSANLYLITFPHWYKDVVNCIVFVFWDESSSNTDSWFIANTLSKDVLFIIRDWNAKVGSQETPRVTGKFGLGIRNEAGQRLIELWQENALVIATQEKTLHMNITRWPIPKSNWLYSLQPKMEKLYTVSKNKTRSWLWLRSWTPYCQIQT